MRRSTRQKLETLALLGTLALSPSCGADAGAIDSPRLVVLYMPCTVRKDFLSPYEESVAFTPNLDRFARQGVVFERHESEAGQSGLAFASILTGTQADGHGIYFHPLELHPSSVTVAEVFAAAGYDTWFWSGQPMASAALGYGQGVANDQTFDRVIAFEEHAPAVDDEAMRRATANEAEFDAILARLTADPEYRAFVQVNYTLTHEPYTQVATRERFAAFVERFPEVAGALTVAAYDDLAPLYEQHRFDLNFDLERVRRQLRLNDAGFRRLCAFLHVLYATCTYELDRYFGQFVDRIEAAGFLDEAVLMVTSDHGESLYRDNALIHWTHGLELAPEVLGVPWIVRAPGRGLAPGRFEPVSRSIDVFPTLAGLCGVPLPEKSARGVDLSPALRGEAEPPRLLAFSHTTTWGGGLIQRFKNTHFVSTYLPKHDAELMWVRVRDEDWVFKLRLLAERDEAELKWVVQAFDLAVDPEERVDRFDAQDPQHAEMAAELERYKQRLVWGFVRRRSGPEGAEALERLKKIGYLR